jgi:hypothetical protein
VGRTQAAAGGDWRPEVMMRGDRPEIQVIGGRVPVQVETMSVVTMVGSRGVRPSGVRDALRCWRCCVDREVIDDVVAPYKLPQSVYL